jgi:hypothetical protein
MFRSFEKSVYTTYLHLRGEPTSMGESVGTARLAIRQRGCGHFEPVARRADFSRARRGVWKHAPLTHT